MRIFVTGATGFIGSHCLCEATRRGHEVVALRRSESSSPRIEWTGQPEWVTGKLGEVAAATLNRCDAVLHLAAHSVAYPHDSLERCLAENVDAPIALFRTAIEAGVDRFVVAGSCFEYGLSGQAYEFIPATAPLLPTNSYAASKAAATIAMHALAVETRIRLSVHRIFHVFGPGEAATRFWPSLQAAALAGDDLPMTLGRQVRDFTPVEFVARELIDACEDDSVAVGVPRITNMGTGRPETLASFAERWWTHFGATGKLRLGEVPYRSGEVMRYVPEIDPPAEPSLT